LNGPKPRLSTTPAGIKLCRLDDLRPGAARNFVLEMRAGWFFGFVVRHGESVVGYVDRCPHMGLPLAQELDRYLSDDGRIFYAAGMALCSAWPMAPARVGRALAQCSPLGWLRWWMEWSKPRLAERKTFFFLRRKRRKRLLFLRYGPAFPQTWHGP
jgi:nitrite reductase/ring-hydroxylating ferredoxin subunit